MNEEFNQFAAVAGIAAERDEGFASEDDDRAHAHDILAAEQDSDDRQAAREAFDAMTAAVAFANHDNDNNLNNIVIVPMNRNIGNDDEEDNLHGDERLSVEAITHTNRAVSIVQEIRNAVVQDFESLLACPVCYEMPRPNAKTIGMCKNGHFVCATCTRTLLETSNCCPQCRDYSVQMQPHHYLFKNLLDMISDKLTYKCQFAGCPQIFKGHLVEEHEKYCHLVPIACPRLGCDREDIFHSFFSGQHNCMTFCRMTNYHVQRVKSNQWEFIIFIQDIYDSGADVMTIKPLLKPILLADEDDPNWRLYFYPEVINDDNLHLCVRWLANRENLRQPLSRQKYKMWITLSTPAGRLSDGSHGDILFANDEYQMDESRIRITRHKLLGWLNAACGASYYSSRQNHRVLVNRPTQTICKDCNNSVGIEPHLHVRIQY